MDMELMEVRNVGVVPGSDSIVVVLQSTVSDRFLAMEIGPLEANAISVALEGIRTPRPLTHDLLLRIVDRLGARVDHVVITRVEDGTFYAELILSTTHGSERIDCRPSDAIATALRAGARIFAAASLLDAAAIAPIGEEDHS